MSDAEKSGFNRRTFLKALGAAGIAASAGGAFLLPGNLLAIPHSEGYLVVDMGKCMGCCTCMTTCSLTHHGKVSLSLSRIQIQQNSFANWPEDISMAICRQCKDAPCVAACPYVPKRLQWDPVHRKTQNCDLCVDTPFLNEKGGTGYSTQKPAVLAIGPAGENQVATACLVHDAGNGAGQGGFGAVWGSKNLKAISVHGSGSVDIADPAALVQARMDAKKYYAADDEKPDMQHWGPFGQPAKPVLFCDSPTKKCRVQSCQGCINGCRARFDIGYGNEVSC